MRHGRGAAPRGRMPAVKRRLFNLLAAVSLVQMLLGCDRAYLLHGHHEDNLDSPPDITMRVGERRQVFWTGITLMTPTPSDMAISDPHPSGAVRLEFPDSGTAYIRAMTTGVARLYYYRMPISANEHNKGFQVTVLPVDTRGKGDTQD